ncbi:MAG: tetratricopeptide repeat-containing sensor histidine kinase [Polaribacter sp.]
MKNKTVLIFVLLTILSLFQVQAKDISTDKEVSFTEASLSFYMMNPWDSEIDKRFDELKKLIENEEYEEALRVAFDLLKVIPLSNRMLKFKVESEIAWIYTRTNSFEKSLEYSKIALQTLTALQGVEIEDKAIFDTNLIQTYYKVGSQFFKLEQSYDSIKAHYLDSAKLYFAKVEEFPSLNPEILDIKGRTYTNLSGLYFMDSLFDKAEEYANKAINIHKLRNNKLSQAGALNNLGNIYLTRGALQMAKDTYSSGIKLIEKDDSAKAIEFKADLYNNLAWTMRKMEDFEAYDFLEDAYEFTDKIRDNEIKRIIEEITAEYNVDKVKDEAEIARRSFWIYVVISLLIITLLATAMILIYQRRKRLALELKNAEMVQKQKVDAVKSESQKRILNAVIEGKEKERKEIAETLHDSVSTLLSSANLHLQASAKQFDGETPMEIIKTKRIISEASTKIRDLSHNLISAILVKFGLTYAIKDLAQKYSNSELRIDTEVRNVGRYSERFEIKVYNIIQEFINNILKHSQASRAFIKIEDINGNIKILIYDNGIGFDLNLLDKKEGIGIKQIEARVQLMEGDFKIESMLDKGTQIEISIPTIEIEKKVLNV